MYYKCSLIHSFDIQVSRELFVLFLLCSTSILLPPLVIHYEEELGCCAQTAVLQHYPELSVCSECRFNSSCLLTCSGFLRTSACGQFQADCTVSRRSGSGKGRRKPLPESKQPSNTTITLGSIVNSMNS